MLLIAMEGHSFFCWQYFSTKGALEFRCLDPRFFFVVGVVGVGAAVEASSEAW